jgi:hypothetical protein
MNHQVSNDFKCHVKDAGSESRQHAHDQAKTYPSRNSAQLNVSGQADKFCNAGQICEIR